MTTQPISYTHELYRKTFHLSSLIIPLVYAFLDRWVMALIMVPFTAVVVILDSRRYTSPEVRALIEKVFGSIMRPHETNEETKRLSGASYMLAAACACILFLPKLIGITAFSVLIISDTAAALIGRKYGKRPYIDPNKSIEGTLAFILSGIFTVFIIGLIGNAYEPVPWEFYLAGIVAVVVGAHVEAISERMGWDDNFSIPISVGGMMLLLAFLTGSYLGL